MTNLLAMPNGSTKTVPLGDLSKLAWPEKQSLIDSLGIEPEAERILNDVWDDSDFEVGHSAFRRGMEAFAATLA